MPPDAVADASKAAAAANVRADVPGCLGRGVLVSAGQAPPSAWAHCERHVVDVGVVQHPKAMVDQLHAAWASRVPIVVELAVDPAEFREPRSFPVAPWQAGARFEPLLDRLHFLVWANNYDARASSGASVQVGSETPATTATPADAPVWWWARKAERCGAARPPIGAVGDVVLTDGRTAWIDGGPRAPVDTHLAVLLGDAVLVHRESVELGRLAVVPAMADPVADLAADQLAAVGHVSGPARVIAPAGSGKTRVLTERLRHLLADRAYEPVIVLALAYNKQAQQELEARTGGCNARVRTLNSFGYRLLGEARGAAPRLLSDREVRGLVESLVEIPRSRWKANTDPLAAYVDALSLTRLALRDPAEVEEERDDIPGFADLFDRYRASLRDLGAIDFDEQIYATIEVLLADGAFRQLAQAGVRHLLVDEFQDLTPAHVLLLRLLCLPQLDCFGVGDDDQVIYGHAGADPAYLIDFAELFPGAAGHALETNYRCAVPIVHAARHLLGYNHRRVHKEIRAAGSAPDGPQHLRVVSPRIEHGASELVAVVRGWLDEPGVRPDSIAVLTRVNSLLLAPQVALAEAGVAVRSTIDDSLLSRTGLRAAFAYLRIGTAGDAIDPSDLTEVLRRPSRGLPQWFPDRLRRRTAWSLRDLRNIAATVSDRDADKVIRFVSDLQMVVDSCRRGTTADVLRVIRDDVGLAGAMSLLDASKGGEGSSHLDDLEALAQVAPLQPDPARFVPWLTDRLRSGGDSGLTLSTIHRVKGREWDRVVVFGVAAGLMPHRLSEDIEEERRVLHVAITRGRSRVVVMSDAARPSPFLAQLDGTAARHLVVAAPSRTDAGQPRTAASAKVPSAKAPVEELTADAEKRFQKLRAWRSVRARRDKVSPFIVAADRTLRAIAKAAPTTLVQLSRVDGIGPTKLESYGDEILAALT